MVRDVQLSSSQVYLSPSVGRSSLIYHDFLFFFHRGLHALQGGEPGPGPLSEGGTASDALCAGPVRPNYLPIPVSAVAHYFLTRDAFGTPTYAAAVRRL